MIETEEKRPRKSGSENRQRSRIIGFRADPVERAEIEDAAERAGLTVGSYVRAMVLKKVRTAPTVKPSFDKVLLTKILGDLGKVGSNLNQIARNLNEGALVSLGRIGRAIDDVSFLREEVIKAIRRPHDNQGQEQGSASRSGELPASDARERER